MYSLSEKASVYWNQFQCNYLQIKKCFLNFFWYFPNLHKSWNTLKKIWASEVIFFWNYKLQNTVLLKCLKSPVSEHFWTVNILKSSKQCLNLHGSIFVKFFDHSVRNQLQKFCFSSVWIIETVSLHIDTRLKVFSLSKSEF